MFVLHMGICNEQYNVIDFSKHENILLNNVLLHKYFSPGEVHLYRGASHNSIIHISIMVSDDVVEDRDKMLP